MLNSQQNGFVNTVDDFKILGIIGKGTYGEVFKAIQISTGKAVALKKVYDVLFQIYRRFVIQILVFQNHQLERFDTFRPFGIPLLLN